jgi:hypothetical protein
MSNVYGAGDTWWVQTIAGEIVGPVCIAQCQPQGGK